MQSDKCSLRNILMRESNVINHIHPEVTTWLVVSLAAGRASELCNTSIERTNILIKYMLPALHISIKEFGMINDTCVQRSMKEGTRKERGEAGLRVQLEGYNQHMLQGKKWQEFLHRGESKE